MARATSRGVSRSKFSGTAFSRVVLGPRPSALRAAAQRASGPTSSPPPQSPVILPSAANRATRPSSATPTQLMPAPQTSATPQPRSVPARNTAKVSFATSVRGAHPWSASAFCRISSSSGRSAPAIITLPTSATGRWFTSTPASVAALSSRVAEHLDRAVHAELVLRAARAPNRRQHRAVDSDQGEVRLRVAAVDSQRQLVAHRVAPSGTGSGMPERSAAASCSSSLVASSSWPISGWASSAFFAATGSRLTAAPAVNRS